MRGGGGGGGGEGLFLEVVQWQSPVFELHLILGHNRCFFAFSGKVHPTNEKPA